MKIPPRVFVLSLIWSLFISAASYFLLWFICIKYAEFLLSWVFFASIIICSLLCYVSAVHYKLFKVNLKGQILSVSKGFIVKRKKHINLDFSVSVKTVSTPLMRLLKLSNILIIFEGSVCLLPLIKTEDADFIYNNILKTNEENEKI